VLLQAYRATKHDLKYEISRYAEAHNTPGVHAEADIQEYCDELGDLTNDLTAKLARPLKRSIAKDLAKTAAANLARAVSLAPRHPDSPHVHEKLLFLGKSLVRPNGLSGLPVGAEGIEEVELVVLRATMRSVVSCHPPYDTEPLPLGVPRPKEASGSYPADPEVLEMQLEESARQVKNDYIDKKGSLR